MNPLLLTDGYKLSHREQYPLGTTKVYSNWTPRKSRIKGIDKIVNFGTQYVIKKIVEDFEKYFFSQQKDYTCNHYKKIVENYLGCEYDVSHIEDLHDLGFLPLEIKSLDEGVLVPMRVPTFTIVNTNPKFFWLVNYLETLFSCMIWQPMTSATIAFEYRKLFENWAKTTGCKANIIKGLLTNVDIQGHDFSMRGMGGSESAILSGIGHSTSFKGSDTLPIMEALSNYYDAVDEFKVCTVPATEHSVMCAGSKDGEFETFKRLVTETYPNGIVSIVSDTWNLWTVLTNFLPRLKNEIMVRNGKVVIRPDSGDPVDIICGLEFKEGFSIKNRDNKKVEINNTNCTSKEVDNAQIKGVVELLWDVFGGTTVVGADGRTYKVLDSHIGCIYGDSITLDRADEICSRLAKKGFASTNWVAGIGSFTYQYNTRDTFGFAMKATYVEINGEGREIFKDPITDDGTKKSARGLLAVFKNDATGDYELYDQVNLEQEKNNQLKTVFKDGIFSNKCSLSDIRKRINESFNN